MATERQLTARELRKRGLSYPQIGAALGCGPRQAASLVTGYKRAGTGRVKRYERLLRQVVEYRDVSPALLHDIEKALK